MKPPLASLCALLLMTMSPAIAEEPTTPPLRVAVIGLVHGHVRGFLPELLGRKDIQLAGVVESDQKLVEAAQSRYHLGAEMFYPTIEALFKKTTADAVAVFTTTFDHKRV